MNKTKQAKMNWRHGNKQQTNSDQRGGLRGIMELRKGMFKLRNMYKAPMNKDNKGGED